MFKYITILFSGSKYKDNIKIYNANDLNATVGLEDEGMNKNNYNNNDTVSTELTPAQNQTLSQNLKENPHTKLAFTMCEVCKNCLAQKIK